MNDKKLYKIKNFILVLAVFLAIACVGFFVKGSRAAALTKAGFIKQTQIGEVYFENQAETEETPYGVNAGIISLAFGDDAIFMTPGTSSVVALNEDLPLAEMPEYSKEVPIYVSISEAVRSGSDGCYLYITLLGEDEVLFEDLWKISSKESWQRFDVPADLWKKAKEVTFEGMEEYAGDQSADWILVRITTAETIVNEDNYYCFDASIYSGRLAACLLLLFFVLCYVGRKRHADAEGIETDAEGRSERALLGIGMLAILIAALWNIGSNFSLTIFGDELGYVQGAAYILGWDWSGVAKSISYYGFGTGLLWAPLFAIFKTQPIVLIKVILVLQGILLSTCMIPAFHLSGLIGKDFSKEKRALLSVAVICLSGNLFYSNMILSEIILTAIFWWTLDAMRAFLDTGKIRFFVVIQLLAIYSYATHSRALAIVLGVCAFDFFCMVRTVLEEYKTDKEKCIKKLALIAVIGGAVILGGMLLVNRVKGNYMDSFYAGNEYTEINLIRNKTENVKELFSLLGLLSFVERAVGNCYYLMILTMGLWIPGIISLFSYFKGWKENKEKLILALVVGLIHAMAIGITVMFFIRGGDTRINDRVDKLFYGRYIEYTLGPLLMYAICWLCHLQWKWTRNVLWISMGGFFLLTVVCSAFVNPEGLVTHMWWACHGIAPVFYMEGSNFSLNILLLGFVRIVMLAVLSMLIRDDISKRKVVTALTVLMAALGIENIFFVTVLDVKPWRDRYAESQYAVVEQIDETEYVVYDAPQAGFFQFYSMDKKVDIALEREELSNYKGKLIVTSVDSEDAKMIKKNHEVIWEDPCYMIWENEK